jgi:serine/threonine protein kinase/Flp pilus assembly protein TadD
LLEPGELLASRFRVIRFIASGGMGDVYESEDTELGERLALKTIRTEVAANPRMLARFKKEIQLAKRISHPNVCRIHDLGMDERPSGRMAFLTMELVDGETLAQHMHANRLTLDQVGLIAAQIAAGLDAAHKARVLHRDLKSSNVILSKEGSPLRAVITDFGTAHAIASERVAATLTKTGEIIGTPDYMAPEQVRGEPTSPATDIYALGVLLFEMVTGRLPFIADTPMGTAVKRLQEPPPSPSLYVPQLPKNWERAILRCLELDPAARFQSAEDLIRFFETERGPARERSLSVLRHHRALLVILTAASLIIGLALWISLRAHSRLQIHSPPIGAPANKAPDSARMHYERGLYFWNLRTQDGFVRAIEEYKKATEADPQYAPAYSGLALVYAMQSGFRAPTQVFPEAKKHAERAIGLNNKLASAHFALAFVKFYYDWDWKGAESEFKKAIELDPGYATAHSNFAMLLAVRNRFDEARQQAKLAETADPVSAAVATGQGRIYYWSGHYREAIEQFQSVLLMHPQFTEARLSLASALDAAGNSDAAVRQISYVLSDSLSNSALADLGSMYARIKERQLALAILRKIESLRNEKKQYVSPCYPAIVYAALGERDQAFKLLNEGITERTFEMVYLNINPEYVMLREDRRWQRLVRSVGLIR